MVRGMVLVVVIAGLVTPSSSRADVDPNGRFHTSIPLKVPEFKGLEPRLALEYSSSSGDGWLGVGWHLGGLSAIQRTGPGRGVPAYDANDRFYLDGMELVRCASGMTSPSCRFPASPDSIGYTTAIESFQRIAFRLGTWVVWTRTGTKLTYERGLIVAGFVADWHLTSVEDPLGNRVTYSYVNIDVPNGVGQESYLRRISYNGVEVTFFYEPRPDPVLATVGAQGFREVRSRLKTIAVSLEGSRVRAYALRYDTSRLGLMHSRLVEVQEFDRDAVVDVNSGEIRGGTALPPTKISFLNGSVAAFAPHADTPVAWSPSPAGVPYNDRTRYRADGIFEVRDGNRWFAGDVNGDGRQDWILVTTRENLMPVIHVLIARADGRFERHRELAPWELRHDARAGPYGSYWSAADVNGDGKMDIVGVSGMPAIPTNTALFAKIVVAFSRGDGTFRFFERVTPWKFDNPTVRSVRVGVSITIGMAGPNWFAGIGYATNLYHSVDLYLYERWFVGDVNGDGKADILAVLMSEGETAVLQAAISTGDDFAFTPLPEGPRFQWPWPNANVKRSRFFAADADGDGKTDLFIVFPFVRDGVEFTAINVARSTGEGGFTNTAFSTGSRWQDEDVWMPGDTNGDGKADLIQVIRHGDEPRRPFPHAALRTWVSDGSGRFPPTLPQETNLLWYLPIPCIGNWTPTVFFPGDADGDGRTDVMQLFIEHSHDCTASHELNASLAVAQSRPKGAFGITKRKSDQVWSWDDSKFYTGITVGDVNGDGRSDVLLAKGKESSCGLLDCEVHGWSLATLLSPMTRSDTHRWSHVDVSGDARTDLVYVEFLNPGVRIHTVVRTATSALPVGPGGKATPVTQDIRPSASMPGLDSPDTWRWLSADLNADGRVDLLYVDHAPEGGSRVYSLLSNGNGTWLPIISLVPQLTAQDLLSWRLADVDSDGRTDLLRVDFLETAADGGWAIRVTTLRALGDGQWDPPSTQDISESAAWHDWTSASPHPSWKPMNSNAWQVVDANGDGRADLMHIDVTRDQAGGNRLSVHTLLALPSGGWSLPRSRVPTERNISSDALHWRFMDVNADGAIDLVHVGYRDPGLSVSTLLNGGGGNFLDGGTQDLSVAALAARSDTQRWVPADVNGDGRTDFVHPLPHVNGGARLVVLMSKGDGTFKEQQFISHIWAGEPIQDPIHWAATDVNGDGRIDFIRTDVYPGVLRAHAFISESAMNLPETFVSPMGGRTDILYKPTTASLAAIPVPGCHLPVGAVQPTVAGVVTHSAQPLDQVTYQYSCPRWSYLKRELLAFDTVTADQSFGALRPSSRTVTQFEVHAEGIVRPVQESVTSSTGQMFAMKKFLYAGLGTVPPFTSQLEFIIEKQCEPDSGLCISRQTGLKMDDVGNVITKSEFSSEGGTILRTTQRAFHLVPGPYILALPRSETIFEGDDLARPPLRTTSFCYDGDNTACTSVPSRGLLTSVRQLNWTMTQPGNVKVPQLHTTTYTYDAHGNIITETDPNGHTTTIKYDTGHHQYPERICNALGQCTVYGWNHLFGTLTWVTDPNKRTTDLLYDSFGRLVTTEFPDGGIHRIEYLDWGSPGRQRVLERDLDGSSDGLWVERHLDGLGRVYRVVRKGDRPGVTFTRDIAYGDDSARPYSETPWYISGTSAPVPIRFQYDAMGRLVQRSYPDGASHRWRYGQDRDFAWVVETNEAGRQRTMYSDARGHLRRVREVASGQPVDTTYEYDALDNLITVKDAAGNVSKFTWDALGQQLSTSDPDMGTWTHVYDAVGNLVSQTDARGFTTVYTYDALNRPKTKESNAPDGGKVEWFYDEPGRPNGIGRLTSVADPSAAGCPERRSEVYDYDSLGQLAVVDKCVLGQRLRTATGYDKLGRLESVTYPDGEQVRYEYDAAGRLARMPGYVTEFHYDAAGHVTTTEFANQTIETRTYNSQREWLTGLSVSKGSDVLFDVGYELAADGRVKATRSMTNKMNLAFGYDDLGRLTTVAGDVQQTLQYDGIGNITFNSRLGAYVYPTPGPNGCGLGNPCPTPHGVLKAGPIDFSYDANGNMKLRSGSEITWNADNLMTRVQLGCLRTLEYRYDAWGDRVTEEQLTNNQLQKRTSFFGPFASSTAATGLTKYYFAGGRLVASRDSRSTVWYHEDRLGSVRAVTSQTGEVVQRYDYAPFGEETAMMGASASFPSDLRFGGASSNDDSGLVYLNARYYDPVLARFISADSVVPGAQNPQALNRYSYVFNEPNGYVDPSGHQPVNVEQPPLHVVDPPRPWRFEPLTITARVRPQDVSLGRPLALPPISDVPLSTPIGASPSFTGPELWASAVMLPQPLPQPLPLASMDPNSGIFPGSQQLPMLYGNIREPLVAAMGGQALKLVGIAPAYGSIIPPAARIGAGTSAMVQGRYDEARSLYASAALQLVAARRQINGAAAARGVTLPDKRVGHIFRDAPGHLTDTPANRQLLRDVGGDPSSRLGADKFGNTWSARTNPDGTQTWVQTRNGEIINGGVNQTPRTFNPKTGLSASKPPGG